MSDAIVIVGAKRTAIGSLLGQFTGFPTPKLGAAAIAAALAQSGVKGDAVSEVIMGCVLPAGLGQAPARQAALAAGLPMGVVCTTINKVCGSGMKAIMLGHDAIQAGSADVVVAGGMESMTNAPHLLPTGRSGIKYGHGQIFDHMAYDGLEDPYTKHSAMGIFAEKCAREWQFSRAEQDEFAMRSVTRAQEAIKTGKFAAVGSFSGGGAGPHGTDELFDPPPRDFRQRAGRNDHVFPARDRVRRRLVRGRSVRSARRGTG